MVYQAEKIFDSLEFTGRTTTRTREIDLSLVFVYGDLGATLIFCAHLDYWFIWEGCGDGAHAPCFGRCVATAEEGAEATPYPVVLADQERDKGRGEVGIYVDYECDLCGV